MTRTSYLTCALIFALSCTGEGLSRSSDAGAGQGGFGGPRRGPASVDVRPSSLPDAGGADTSVDVRGEAGGTDAVTSSPDLAPDLRVLADVSADLAPDVQPDASPEAGREAPLTDVGPDLLVAPDLRPILPEAGPEASPDLRPILPEAGPEAKKCADECNTGCNVGCGPNGQCVACPTCTCEIASGTCHC